MFCMFAMSRLNTKSDKIKTQFFQLINITIMKTSTQKTLFATLVIMFVASQAFGQMNNTRIDVKGSRYSDCMWMFAVPSCTTGFDNGWDASKMFATNPIVPSIFAWEGDSYFQIDVILNI